MLQRVEEGTTCLYMSMKIWSLKSILTFTQDPGE
jgi:hypothetical protein